MSSRMVAVCRVDGDNDAAKDTTALWLHVETALFGLLITAVIAH